MESVDKRFEMLADFANSLLLTGEMGEELAALIKRK
jgi:hypothetical protein